MSILVAAIGLVVACGKTPPPTGSLSITVAGLPAGVSAAVTVSGPAGYAETVTSSRVLTGLTPGGYSVAAATVDDGHPIVPAVYDAAVTAPAVTVVANETEVATVVHTWRAPTGRAWVSKRYDGDTVLVGFAAEQLETSGAPEPAVRIDSATSIYDGIAFDALGNVWVADFFNDALIRFAAADLASSGTRLPDLQVASSSTVVLRHPVGLAFDANGFLWVSGYWSNTVVGYAPSQLAAAGSPVPQVVLEGFSMPGGMAFDATGNLWVANMGDATITMFTPAQLTASGTPTATVAISSTAGYLANLAALAFDAAGSLWASSFGYGVVRFDPDQLVATGSPTPAARLTGFGSAKTLAFDHAGDLWISRSEAGSESLVRLADPGSLAGEATAVFATEVAIAGEVDGGFVTFFPTPPGLPIRRP